MQSVDDAMISYVKETTRQESTEIYAAWRSEYDYLHVYEDIGDDFTLRRSYIPCNTPATLRNKLARVYDLRDEKMSPQMRQTLRDYSP